MKMDEIDEMHDDLRSEYKRSDFGEMVKGKYAQRLRMGSNIVLLEPEIASAFPTDQAVNEALRMVMKMAELPIRPPSSEILATSAPRPQAVA